MYLYDYIKYIKDFFVENTLKNYFESYAIKSEWRIN